MAVSISAVDLAVTMRLVTDPNDLPVTQLIIVSNLLDAYGRLAEKKAPHAPAAVLNEAVVRMAAYAYELGGAELGDVVGNVNVYQRSGAAALLAPWRVHSTGERSEPGILTPAIGTIAIAVGWSADNQIDSNDLVVASSSDNARLPPESQNGYVVVWRANDAGGAPDIIIIGGRDSTSFFLPAEPLEYREIEGYARITADSQNGILLGDTLVVLN